MWNYHEEYKDLILKSWKQDPAFSAMENWSSNLSNCGKSLKAWSKDKFLNSTIQVNELLADIEKLYESNQPNAM